nr:VanZ family protein [uncultured Flavobacterium sp.]
MKYTSATKKNLEKIVALVYLALVVYITLIMGRSYGKTSLTHKISLVPLETKMYFFERFTLLPRNHKETVIKEIMGNFFLFMPFSWSLQSIRGRKIKALHTLIYIIVTVFIIESIQYFFNIGTFDIDDFILNISGGIAGIFIFKYYKKLKR